MRLVWGTVSDVVAEEPGLQKLTVVLDAVHDAASPAHPDSAPVAEKAVSYPKLSGECALGDRVLLNTTAVDLGLGTGGVHFVVARKGSGSGVVHDSSSGGHVMKLRYSPLQTDVVSVEAPEAPTHDIMVAATSLEGLPVVCCGLHSQVPLVAAAVKRARPDARVIYCASDGAALPLALSDLVRGCRRTGLLDATISCGQSFGGDFEAVNLHSGLLAARHVCGADVAIVAIGPGVVGTATPFGHGGVAQGEAINAVAALAGTPVACLRVSFADARERHRGVSHHTLAALTSIALAPAVVAVPTLSREYSDAIAAGLDSAGVAERHTIITSPEGSLEPPSMQGLRVTTMGRGPSEDPAFFAAAFAAGEIASRTGL